MNFVCSDAKRRPGLMQAGDLVVIYERHDALDHFYLKRGEIFQNKFGAFHHNDMIGKPFGSKIASKNSTGWIYALRPTPELWSVAVHTRTQIVNELDSSVVTLLLDVYPGCKVVESGTGSGCMTLSLARAVAPSGHVYTFEYNAVRAAKAVAEFQRLKVSELVTVQCRDVCGKYDGTGEGGFGGLVADQSADAVFLDLPEPWLALDYAKKVLKPGRGICCYSPCIEQVTKACEKLRELGFHSIRMMEVRQRPYDARVVEMDTLNLGLEEEEEKAASSSRADPTAQRQRYRSLDPPCLPGTDLATGRRPAGDKAEGPQGKRRKRERGSTGDADAPSEEEEGGEDEEQEGGEGEEEEGEGREEEGKDPGAPASVDAEQQAYLRQLNKRILNRPKSSVTGYYNSYVARPVFTMKGHTAFLTFAVRPFEASAAGGRPDCVDRPSTV